MKRTWIETPWGPSEEQFAEHIAPGITFYATASHGGYRVDMERNKQIPEEYRIQPGPHVDFVWYEEDCGWAPLALTWPELFSRATKAAITGMLPHWKKWVDMINSKDTRPYNRRT